MASETLQPPDDGFAPIDGESGPAGAEPDADGGRRAPRVLSVLLAEDNRGDARLLEETLKDQASVRPGITRTETLAATLERLEGESFDLLLLDLGLPDSAGIETVRSVLSTDPDAAVVVLTGMEDEAMAERALREGAQDYLVKGRTNGRQLARALRYAQDRREAEARLRESRRLLRAIVEGTTDGIFVKDLEGEILFANVGAARMLGCEAAEDVVGRRDEAFLTPETVEMVRKVDRAAVRSGRPLRVEEHVATVDGTRRVYEVAVAPLGLGGGEGFDAIVGVARDVTESTRARQALARAEEKFSTAFQITPLPMAISRLADGHILEVNEAFAEVYGADPEAVLGRTAAEAGLWTDLRERERFMERLRTAGEVRNMEVSLRHASGDVRTVLLSARPMELDGEPCVLTTGADITDRKAFERELERRALFDELTGLPNRTLFRDRLRHALERSSRSGRGVGVLFLDLDRFKVVNDSLGHAAGDELLAGVAERIRGCFREEDTVARLGGDEFAALLEQVEEVERVETAAARLAESFERPFRIAGSDIHASASIGIAHSSRELASPEDLLRFSDVAMYRAKAESGTSVSVFDPERDSEATERLQLENALRLAVEREEVRTHFQPLVSLPDRDVIGIEALARWRRPDHGEMSPAEFIPVAEETGLIVPLGLQMLRRAAGRVAAWRDRTGTELVLDVNLSARQMQEPDVVADVLEALAESGLPPACLVVEITESVAVRNVDAVRQFRERGVKVALDDLGTGYASLEYLTRLEVDLLKVDRTFVTGLGDDPRGEAVVEAILLVADRLGLPVVAEGIETEAQRARLLELGCGFGQGFLFAPPLEPEEMERLVAEGGRW